LPLSPYFSAAKLAWIMRNVPDAKKLAEEKNLCMGTVDSWLIHKMTGGEVFKTDYSNASRTQLFNIKTLTWDEKICAEFGISLDALPEVTFSDSFFGKIIESAAETETLARQSNPADKSYFVPAFTGLGAPYYDNDATGFFTGITRVTGKNEMVRSVIDSIAYQIYDVIHLMEEISQGELVNLKVDGGPTRNSYLMQIQSNILNKPVAVPPIAELSAMGAAYCAGIAAGFYDKEKIFAGMSWEQYAPDMNSDEREKLLKGWHKAIKKSMSKNFREV